MAWTQLTFGKHEGKTLPQVLFADPDWFFWAWEQNAFHGVLATQAAAIHRRATGIRVPDIDGEPARVEYSFDAGSGRFACLETVPVSWPHHEGGSPTARSTYIDMSVPRQVKDYDKTGMAIFVRDLKAILFGDSAVRMTKRRCEEFFDDPSNFIAP